MFQSVFDALKFYSEKQPNKLCIADDNKSYTYSEFLNTVSQTALILKDSGIGEGDYVVIEADNSIDYIAIRFALMGLKAVFVPLEKRASKEKINDIKIRCNAKLVISNSSDITIKKISELAETCEKYTFVEKYNQDDVCEILFSTGTTGKEKGIIITNQNNIALAENVIYGVEMQPDNIELIPSPLNHSHGLRRLYANIFNGSSAVITNGVLNVLNIFNLIDKYNVNSMDIVPTALSILLKLSKNKLSEYRDKIRYIQFGAAALMQSDKDKIMTLLPDTRLYNFYGSTESGCIAIYNFNDGHDKTRCVGKPTYNAKILICDDDINEINSSPENTGRIISYGKMNTPGYFNDEDETKKAIINGGVFSKDEAYYDDDGDIILLGRKGDVINVGGNKVSPDEIEDVCKKYNYVADCACIAVKDELKGQVPKLFVKINNGYIFNSQSIRNDIALMVEPYKVPKYIVETDEIPRTYNGKIKRSLLK